MERLEAREVPATAQWLGVVSTDFNTAQNWSTGAVPGPGDSLVFASTGPGGYGTGQQQQPPGSPPAPPVPPGNPNRDCVFPTEAEKFFPRIDIKEGYSGTVRFPVNIKFGYYLQSAGSTWQAAGTAVTVTTGFEWTRGAINPSGTDGSVVKLEPGAIGTITPVVTAPLLNGSVTLGSEIRLLGDGTTYGTSTLTMNNGVYDLVGGFFNATRGSQLILAPVPKFPSVPGDPSIFVDNKKVNKPTVRVGEGARGKVTSVGRSNSTEVVEAKLAGDADQFQNRGDTRIESYTRLKIKNTGPSFAKYFQDYDPAEGDAKPITRLQAGSEIVAENDGDRNKGFVHIEQGEFQVYGVPGLGDANQPDAVVSVPDKDKSPALYLAQVTKLTTHFFSDFVKLKVDGDVVCLGDIFFRADRGTALNNDSLSATGAIVFGPRPLSPSQLTVTWRNPGAALAAVDSQWKFLHSNDPLRANAIVFPAIPGVTTLPTLRAWPNETEGTIADLIEALDIGMKRTA